MAEEAPSPVNFFLVGAAKSATTTLYHALRAHDEVFLPDVKEPHLYAYLADPAAHGHLYPDAATARHRYRDLYAGVAGEAAVGDASTSSLVVAGAAEAIAADVPRARIVAILRQPVDRAFAHWRHFVGAGAEDAGFADAIAAEGERQEACYPMTYEYLRWGRYGEQLAPYYERFGAERVLVHLYDDLCDEPAAVVRRTFDFLGVDPAVAMAPVGRHNQVPQAQPPRRRLRGWRLQRPDPPKLDPELRSRLTRRFDDDLTELERLLGRDLSAWR